MTEKELLANIAPFGLRMQSDLKERLKAVAEQNGRSMNAEIVGRLEASLSDTNSDAEEWKRRYEAEREASLRFERLYDSTFDVAMNYRALYRASKSQMLQQVTLLNSLASVVIMSDEETKHELVELARRIQDQAKHTKDALQADLQDENQPSFLARLQGLVEQTQTAADEEGKD